MCDRAFFTSMGKHVLGNIANLNQYFLIRIEKQVMRRLSPKLPLKTTE